MEPVLPTRAMLRPFATPLPLGFLALMVATATLGTVQLHWLPATQGHVAALVTLLFAAPLQLLACVFGFLTRDAVAATGMGILSATWLLIGLVTLLAPPKATSGALGVMLLCSTAALLVPAAAGTSKAAAAAVMALAAARFAVTAIYELTRISVWQTAAGAVGLALAVLALYAALGFDLEGAKDHTVLPLGRSAPIDDQPEPGLRRRL